MAHQIYDKPLREIWADIRDGIIDVLKQGDGLDEVAEIFYGRRARIGTVRSPALWVVAESHTPEPWGGHTMTHDFTFTVVALVKDRDPADAIVQAERLSAAAYDAMKASDTLNGVVAQVIPQQVDPGADEGAGKQLCFSAVQFVYRIRRRE